MTNGELYDLDSVFSVGEADVDEIVSDESADGWMDDEPSRYLLVKGDRVKKAPIQFLKDLKIAEILGRGTLCEEEEKQRLHAIRSKFHPENTEDNWKEIQAAASDIERVLKSKTAKRNREELFKSIVQTVDRELTVENIDNFGAEGGRDINVSELAMELLDSSSGDETSDELEADSPSYLKDKWEEKSETVDSMLLGGGSTRTAYSQKITSRLLEGGIDSKAGNVEGYVPHRREGIVGEFHPRVPAVLIEPNSQGAMVEESKITIALKKRLYRTLKVQTEWLEKNPALKRHKLYRLWLSNMMEALKQMQDQITNQEEELKSLIDTVKYERLGPSEDEKGEKDDITLPGERLLFTLDQMKNALNMINCRRQYLMEQHNAEFFSKKSNFCESATPENNLLNLLKVYKTPAETGILEASSVNDALVVAKCLTSGHELTTEINLGPEQKVVEYFSGLVQSPSTPTSSSGSNSKTNDGRTPETFTDSRCQHSATNSLPIGAPQTLEGCFNILRKFLTEVECNMIIRALDLEVLKNEKNDGDKAVESMQSVIPTKEELSTHSIQIVYIFKYKPCYPAVDIVDSYDRYIHMKNPTKHIDGCLLLYNNVYLGIVLVEGSFELVIEHFATFRNSDLYRRIEIGRLLFCRKTKEKYFREWISFNIAKEPEKLEYMNKEKKILENVAKLRVSQLSDKLKSLYVFLTDPKNRHKLLQNVSGTNKEAERSKKPNIRNCGCKETCSSSLERIETNKVFSADMLPSPAQVEYLLKYKSLKSLDRFLDDLVREPLLDSDDEVFDASAETKLNRYIDDELWDQPEAIEGVKKTYKLQEIIRKIKKEFNEKLTIEAADEEPPWLKEYDLEAFTPCVAQVEIKKQGDECQQVLNVRDLVDTDEDRCSDADGSDRFMRFEINRHKYPEGGHFYTAGEGEKDVPRKWQKKCAKFGLKGHELKEMLEDAQKYKELKKAMQSKRKTQHTEQDGIQDTLSIGFEEESAEEEEEEDEEEGETSALSFGGVETLESIVEQTEEMLYEEAVMMGTGRFQAGESVQQLPSAYKNEFNFNGEDAGEFLKNQREIYKEELREIRPAFDFDNPEDDAIEGEDALDGEDALGGENVPQESSSPFNEPEILGEPEESLSAVPKSLITLVDSSTGPMGEDDHFE